jgi:Cysteine-rich secretory protein family
VNIDSWSSEVVSLHNQYRAQYGAQAVTWSQSLYSDTLDYAKGCIFKHRYDSEQFFCVDIKVNAYFISDPEGKYGENLVGHLLFSKIREVIRSQIVCKKS